MGEVTGFISKRLKLKGTLATVCTAVSFFVIIIAVAISSGFRQEIRNGLSLAGGDVRIIPTNHDYLSEGNPIPTDAPYFEKITELPIVESIYPVIYRAGIVKSGGQIHGVMVKGVEPSHPMCPAEGELNVRVPQSLCDALELDKESSVLTYFIGERVQVRKFKITEIYKDVLDNKEMCVVYAPIATLRRLNRWEDNQISAVEINLNITSEDAIKSATGDIGMLTSLYSREDDTSVYATNIISSYPQLFDWLRLIDFNVGIVLLIMIIVAGFNMISGLLIILFENISTIGLLKSLGMNDRGIAKVFLRSSSDLTLKGLAIGNVAAFIFCIIQASTHVLKLNPNNYFVDHVPVALNLWNILLSDVVAYIAIMVMLLIPTIFISKVDPAKSLKVN